MKRAEVEILSVRSMFLMLVFRWRELSLLLINGRVISVCVRLSRCRCQGQSRGLRAFGSVKGGPDMGVRLSWYHLLVGDGKEGIGVWWDRRD